MSSAASAPLAAALAAANSPPIPQPETVHFRPADCALLIGAREVLLQRLEAMKLAGLRTPMSSTDATEMPRGLRSLSGELADVSGWMGAFTSRMVMPQGAVDLSTLSYHDDDPFRLGAGLFRRVSGDN